MQYITQFGLVMSKMSSNYAKDPSVNLSFAISSEKNGVESVIESYKKGTEEVRNLLRNECEVIYECRLIASC